MANDKDFRVKNGLDVGGNASVSGSVTTNTLIINDVAGNISKITNENNLSIYSDHIIDFKESDANQTVAQFGLNSNGNFTFGSSLDTNYKVKAVGNIYATTDLRSPIYYDSDNTSYYANLADSGTSLYARGTIGNIVNQDTWAFRGVTANSGINFSGLWFTGDTARILLRDATGTIQTQLSADGTTANNKIGGNSIFHDGYHPNADKWTTARTNTVTLTGNVTGSGSASVDGSGNWTVSVPAVVANDSHSHSNYVLKTGDTMTGTLAINNIDASLQVGNVTSDIFTEIKHINTSGYGFTFQHANASLFINQQGGTNQVLVLGDVDAGNTTTLFGIGHSADSGVTWTPKLNFRGDAELFIGTSGTSRVFHDGYHPNADKWTTARTNTVTLTGDVTGTGSASVDGSGNWTVSVASDLTVSSTDTFTGTYPIAWLATNNLYQSSWLVVDGVNDRLRSPQMASAIYYDLNNTNYYSDPASTSNINILTVATINRDPTVTLSGDVTGSATMTNLGSINITTTVTNDSHSHSNYVLKTGDTMTGNLTMASSSDILASNYTSTIYNIMAGHNPEGRLFRNPLLVNDLAYNTLKGNAVTFTNGTISSISQAFEPSGAFASVASTTFNPDGVTPIVMEFDVQRTLLYSCWFGISFGNSTWRCNYVKLEAFSEGAWVTVTEVTNNTEETVMGQVPGNAASGTTKFRISLRDPNTTSVRITHIFAYNYNSPLATNLYLSNGGGTVYGDISAQGGISGLTLASGISGNNFNITGVNQLEIADPGEGIVWTGGSSGNITLATVDDASDNILRLSGTGASLQVGTNTVFHDGYHPNADKWTTARTNTVTLTGSVTGTGSASVDGSGNWTVTVPTTTNHTHNYDNYGSWIAKDHDGTTYTVTSGDTLWFKEGGAIDVNFTADDELTISHADTSTQASVNNSNGTVIQDITLDTYGHITAIGSVDLDGRYQLIAAPAAPSITSTTLSGETVEIVFAQSATSGVNGYEIWSDGGGVSFALIGRIPAQDIAASMSFVDTTFTDTGTINYRVYAIRNGVYSTAATTTATFSVPSLDVANFAAIPDLNAFHLQYDLPVTRFLDHIEIYLDTNAASGSLARANATLIYSGDNSSYTHNISASDRDNYHQFWVECVGVA